MLLDLVYKEKKDSYSIIVLLKPVQRTGHSNSFFLRITKLQLMDINQFSILSLDYNYKFNRKSNNKYVLEYKISYAFLITF